MTRNSRNRSAAFQVNQAMAKILCMNQIFDRALTRISQIYTD